MTESPSTSSGPCRLVICFDDAPFPYETNPSNIMKMYLLLRNEWSQKVLYYSSVGSVLRPSFWSLLFGYRNRFKIEKYLDNAFAMRLSEHIMICYEWLVLQYNPGDRVYFFGFSRGAYIARVIAAMLQKIGLVLRDKLDIRKDSESENLEIQTKVSMACDLYMSNSDEVTTSEFKKQYCHPIHIDFFGVWDTLSSVGLLSNRTLAFVDASDIQVFRQALSLDEHRSGFHPNLYHHDVDNKLSELPEREEVFKTDVKEVWFAGCQTDVGGGSVPETAQHDLANISLRWMLEELVHSGCQMLYHPESLVLMKIPSSIAQDQLPFPRPEGPSTNEDVDALNTRDALQPITDKLFENTLWWILEILPMPHTFQNMQGKWVTTFRPHFGQPRRLPQGALFHTSVKTRMDDPNLGYKPRAWYEHGTEKYVS